MRKTYCYGYREQGKKILIFTAGLYCAWLLPSNIIFAVISITLMVLALALMKL